MPISFGGIIIADHEPDQFDGAEGINVSARPAAQSQPVIDSAAPVIIHRGNISYSITLTSRKRHVDAPSAKTYCGTHAAALAAGDGNFVGLGLNLSQGTCEVSTRVIGLTTQSTYNITAAHAPA